MGHKGHHKKSHGPVSVFVVTVSDTRTEETDTSGGYIIEKLTEAGNTISGRLIVRDEPDKISDVFDSLPEGTQAAIFNGGTGVSSRDGTYEVIESKLDKTLPGFGELFRALSYEEIGPAAIMSRAVAGVAGGVAVISIPGSRGAVALAMEKIILPELAHIVWEISR